MCSFLFFVNAQNGLRLSITSVDILFCFYPCPSINLVIHLIEQTLSKHSRIQCHRI